MNTTLLNILATATLLLSPFRGATPPQALSQVQYSLSNRYAVPTVNEVFSDNILLTLSYLEKKVERPEAIDWNVVRSEREVRFALHPGETFAFHDAVLPQYQGRVAQTTNAHFNAIEGFKSDGWLVGDGVCHLASFMYVAAKDAALQVEAPTSHDFAVIPNIEKRDGVSIYSESSIQNLYITNNKTYSIVFVFTYNKGALAISVEKVI